MDFQCFSFIINNKRILSMFRGYSVKVIHGRNIRTIFTLATFTLMLLLPVSVVDAKKSTAKCTVCKDIVANFHKGLSSTQKSNYGGGNTKWEEKSLGSYATSEVRLVEILEKLCDDGAKECHTMLEAHEELVERYWFKEFAQKKDTDFYGYFCIDHMQVCCPNNTYGKDCTPCPGSVDRPCNGHGDCDGMGTRGGNGKCKCKAGYGGDLCNQCKDGYFEEYSNDTHTSCRVCHISCKNICSEDGPQGCDECKNGWEKNEELGCQDINECLEEHCDENQYCVNTQGSFTCFTCDDACESCTGSGPDKCNECSAGFTRNEETSVCIDNDECITNAGICTGEQEVCKNVPGSYECGCKTGFTRRDNMCLRVPKDNSNESDNVDDSEDNSDLPTEDVKEEL
uniref:EGF-like domain-containing protein n=1 Tax=Arion vulgaris TaxID=1028688 RepID=A0A0B6Y7W6_9EUPU